MNHAFWTYINMVSHKQNQSFNGKKIDQRIDILQKLNSSLAQQNRKKNKNCMQYIRSLYIKSGKYDSTNYSNRNNKVNGKSSFKSRSLRETYCKCNHK